MADFGSRQLVMFRLTQSWFRTILLLRIEGRQLYGGSAMNRRSFPQAALVVILLGGGAAQAQEKSPAERGREALLGKSFAPAFISAGNFENLWKQWNVKAKPADVNQVAMDRYGLHPAPYANKGLPMGLRESKHLFGKGVGFDCMLCHASSLMGQ